MALIVAIVMPVLIVFGALAIDVGSWYLTQAQLQNAADFAALAGAQDLPSNPGGAATAAQNVATENAPGTTITSVTPYNASSGEIQVTVSERDSSSFWGSAPTITVSAVAESTAGAGASAIFAASTACNAISISNTASVYVSAVWTNGGITASNNAATSLGQAEVANSSCPFPGGLGLSGPTTVANYPGWPVPLPTAAQGNFPSSCQSANITISGAGSGWATSNPPGIYCTTGTISIFNTASLTLNGYEFVSKSTSSTAISISNAASLTFTGYCPSSCSAGSTPRTLLYATAGGISLYNVAANVLTGDMFAPAGNVTLTNSADFGNASAFIETQAMSITNSASAHITGIGPGGPSGTVRLIG